MCEDNQTQVTYIRLLGFRDLYKFKALLFIVFLLIYLLILAGNILIIILVTAIDDLKVPMFFFLKHLSAADLLLTTSVAPMTLDIILHEEVTVSIVGCITQLYCFCIFASVPCFLIAVMSYDRFLAICYPLRYTSMMSPNVCLHLGVGSWLLITIFATSEMVWIYNYNFCGQDYIDHFFCDFGPLVELSTSDTSILLLQDFVISSFVIFVTFAFIIMTYCSILFTIIKMTSQRRRKAFSTCSSHLTSVCTYYCSLMIVYMAPSNESSVNINKYLSLLYIMMTPLMNPIIYSLRSQKMKRGLRKYLKNIRTNIFGI